MSILLAFSPFLAFALVDRVVGPLEGLIAGAVAAAALLGRDASSPGRSIKVLDVGTVILFGGLVLYTLVARPTWSVIAVRLCVDAGLLAVVLVSMLIGRPFTMQYAREQVSAEYWDSPEFRHTNMVITAAWAAAFAVMVAAELALLYLPDMPHRLGIIAIVLALVGAVKFTAWYPEQGKPGSDRR